MRKKLLLEQIEALTYSYRQASLKINELKNENEALLSRIDELEKKLSDKEDACQGFTVNSCVEESVDEQIKEKNCENKPAVELDKSMEFGAEIIGKIIIESAKYSEKITGSQNENLQGRNFKYCH